MLRLLIWLVVITILFLENYVVSIDRILIVLTIKNIYSGQREWLADARRGDSSGRDVDDDDDVEKAELAELQERVRDEFGQRRRRRIAQRAEQGEQNHRQVRRVQLNPS